MITGCIFDMDGVLLDSMELWNRVAELYLQEMGIEAQALLADQLKVLSMEEAAELLQRSYGIQLSVSEIIHGLNQVIQGAYENTIPLKPGVIALLTQLNNMGIPVIVGTSSQEHLAKAAFQRLGIEPYIQGIVTDAHVGKGKRFPDLFLNAAAKINSPVESTWIFEDSLHAMETGKKAGFLLAGVRDIQSPKELEQIQELCDCYLENLLEFQGILEKEGIR